MVWTLGVLALDLLTLNWFPVPWNDEVMFADPAATLLLQGHWASAAWYGRGDLIYWTGNSPAYSFLLVPWLWVWGVNAPGVRSLNCLLIAAAMIFTWFAVKRLKLISSPALRLAALAALSLCYPVSFCVRTGRSDVVGMLLFALGAWLWAGPRPAAAKVGLFFCAAMIPFAGLHYAFYMPILLGVLLWAGGRASLGRIYAIICGGLAGGLLFAGYHHFFAGWDGLLANMADVRDRRPAGIWPNLRALFEDQILHYYLKRPHFLLLLLLALVVGLSWKKLCGPERRSWWQAVVILFASGLLIGAGAQFRAPYQWLAVAPALILLVASFGGAWKRLGQWTKWVCLLLLLGIGLSGRLVFLSLGEFLQTASYTAKAGHAAGQLVAPGEKVYCDWQVYYDVKPRAGGVFFDHVIPKLTHEEKASISLAFLHPDGKYEARDVRWLEENLGGSWTAVATLPDPRSGISPWLASQIEKFNPECFIGTGLIAYRRTGQTNSISAYSATPGNGGKTSP